VYVSPTPGETYTVRHPTAGAPLPLDDDEPAYRAKVAAVVTRSRAARDRSRQGVHHG